jgi:hypothetical protein
MDRTLTGLANRGEREMVSRVAPVRAVIERRYASRRARYQPQLPPLGAAHRALVAELEREGVVRTPFEALEVPNTADLQEELLECVELLRSRGPHAGSSESMSYHELVQHLPIWRMGLTDALLDIAENHVGLPLTYHGAFVARQLADGRAVGTRRWHRDIEDRRMMKILLWLNDVDAEGGPFEYIPAVRSAEIGAALHYAGGFVSEDTLGRFVAPEEHCAAVGRQWTTVLADTARVFHRGRPPRGTDRYALTLTWTSANPVKALPNEPFTPEHAALIRAGLTPRQSSCLRRDLQG